MAPGYRTWVHVVLGLLRRGILGVAALLALSLAPANVASAQTDVTYPSRDGTLIRARLLLPTGPGPHPAILALHGCDGPNDNRGELGARGRDWADRWLAQGFAVLFPDSFASRGVASVCRQADRVILPGRERLADVQGARVFLQSRPDIRADRINLVGWSHGGSTVLWAVRPAARPNDGKPDFASAVAFYPGCRAIAERGVPPRLRLMILMGEADQWTPAPPCADYARASGPILTYVGYPEVHHGFDAPNTPLRQLSGLTFTADGSGRAIVGTNPAARADAIGKVSAFVRR